MLNNMADWMLWQFVMRCSHIGHLNEEKDPHLFGIVKYICNHIFRKENNYILNELFHKNTEF